MKRINVVWVVGIVIGLGYAQWGYSGTSESGNRVDGDVEHKRGGAEVASVTPDPKASDAAEAKKSTVEEKIAWGKETGGLVANLRALTTVVKPGEPIEFEIRVKNVSNEDAGLPSGLAGEKVSACFWMFYFDQWEWRPPQLQARIVPLKPGETASVRCLVATTPDSMTAEQGLRFRFPGPVPFRHIQNKNESDRLPEGNYRVRAKLDGNGVESNIIEVRIINRR